MVQEQLNVAQHSRRHCCTLQKHGSIMLQQQLNLAQPCRRHCCSLVTEWLNHAAGADESVSILLQTLLCQIQVRLNHAAAAAASGSTLLQTSLCSIMQLLLLHLP
jgi:hypothetical protein